MAWLWLVVGVAHADASPRTTVLVWGDSLSSAYGIAREAGWVAKLTERLATRGVEVVNASISGETTQGGLTRLPRAIEKHRPALVILELGGNDGLRALSLAQTEANLAAMIELAQGAGAKVLLLGMRIPPNYGPAYTEAFAAIYPKLAKRYGTGLVPFFLEGVATDPALMQADGIHPTAEAQSALLDNVWPHLEPLLPAAARAGR